MQNGAEASISEASAPGPKVVRRQAGKLRAEKSHSNARGGDITGRLRYEVGTNCLLSIAARRSVGELTANNTRRVKLGAKCQ
jgi:hypothetical protein